MNWFKSNRCPESTKESDGRWRCGKEIGHSGVHQAYKRGQWFAIWWSDSDAELDRYFGIPVE